MSKHSNYTHLAFADESRHNVGRYRGVAVTSVRAACYREISQNLLALREESQVREVHWKELNGAKERFCASKWIRAGLTYAKAGRLRIDVLAWDTEDSRHKLPKRDDVENLHRMYHHLCSTMLVKRWPNEAIWRLHPDENTLMNWESVHEWLDRKSVGGEVLKPNLVDDGKLRIRFWDWFKLEKIEPVSSATEPLVQVADLLLGLAIYSRETYTKLDSWRKTNVQSALLDLDETRAERLSGADRERCQLLHDFEYACKSLKLGVSLNSERRLRTPNPNNPINFWWWEPQHENDKAPVRTGKAK